MEEARLKGKRYSLWFMSEYGQSNSYTSGGDGYYEGSKWRWHRYGGSAEVVDSKNSRKIHFNFLTTKEEYPDDKNRYCSDLEKVILTEEDRRDYTPLPVDQIVDMEAAIDLFTEKVLKLVRASQKKSERPIPRIELPAFKKGELVELGLMADSEEQLVLRTGT